MKGFLVFSVLLLLFGTPAIADTVSLSITENCSAKDRGFFEDPVDYLSFTITLSKIEGIWGKKNVWDIKTIDEKEPYSNRIYTDFSYQDILNKEKLPKGKSNYGYSRTWYSRTDDLIRDKKYLKFRVVEDDPKSIKMEIKSYGPYLGVKEGDRIFAGDWKLIVAILDSLIFELHESRLFIDFKDEPDNPDVSVNSLFPQEKSIGSYPGILVSRAYERTKFLATIPIVMDQRKNGIISLNCHAKIDEIHKSRKVKDTLIVIAGIIAVLVLLILIWRVIKRVKKSATEKANSIIKMRKERQKELKELKIAEIAEDEAIRNQIRETMDVSSSSKEDLQKIINRAIEKGDTETAQALLKILENK